MDIDVCVVVRLQGRLTAVLKACSSCGRIHDSKHICQQKSESIKNRQKKYKATDKDKFRWTKAWQDKRYNIKERDLCLCVICRSRSIYTYNNLSCHHIEPLEERYDLRLDDNNLITVCDVCHEDAESGKLNREWLHSLVKGDK